MLRWVVLLLVLGLGLGGWLLLRSPEPAAPARALRVEPEPEPTSAKAELREDTRELAERTSVAEHEDAGTAEPTAPAIAATGVLAGQLRLDGGPLVESAVLFLAAADRSNAAHAAANGELRTDALGRFRREGLPEDWSGSLHLRPPYAVPLAVTAARGWTRSVDVERLRQDLSIEVVRLPQVRVRVLHADRSPAADVTVRLRQVRGGSSSGDGSRTDAAGIARFDRVDPPPERVELSARTDDGASAVRLFEGDALPALAPTGDLDLGDAVLIEGRRVALHVQDERGAPLAGLQLAVLQGSRKEILRTDGDGIVTLGFESEALQVAFEADGWWPAEVLLPAGVEQHDVTLRRANRLRVEVVDALDRPLAAGRVRFSATRPLFGEERPFPPGFVLSNRDASASDDGSEHHCEFSLDEHGVVECSGFVPGLELRVLLRDPLEAVAAQELVPGLGEAEQRTVRLRVERQPCTLEVRVLGADARPLAGARVRVQHEGSSITTQTDAEGFVRVGGLLATPVEVSALSADSTEEALSDVDPCARPVALHLAAAHTLEVELRDEAGQPVRAGRLALSDPGGTRVHERRTPTGGFAGLPFEPLVLVWDLCGRQRRLDIGPSQTSAVLVVPPLGEVVVSSEGWERTRRRHARLRIEPLDGGELACDDVHLGDGPRSVPLWPGRYRLRVEVHDYESGVPPVVTPLGAPREVQVDAGSTQPLTFRP